MATKRQINSLNHQCTFNVRRDLYRMKIEKMNRMRLMLHDLRMMAQMLDFTETDAHLSDVCGQLANERRAWLERNPEPKRKS
jgi:hypothetical protein